MDPVSFKINPLLREAAELKIEELDQAKQAFKHRYLTNNTHAERFDIIERLSTLLDDIRTLDSYLEDDDELSTISRYVEQAKDDLSISEKKLLKFEQQLRSNITEHANRLETSSLHAELLREAMADDKSVDSMAAQFKAANVDDFEVIENGVEQFLEKYEAQISTVKEVDSEALEQYLSSMMELNDDTEALEELRNGMQKFGNEMVEEGIDVEQDELMWWILALLKSDLISVDKRKTLESYLLSPMVIRELLSTLNLKPIRDWDWKNPKKGLPLSAHIDSCGEYYATIDEDTIDMLFLHAIATGWATQLKQRLRNFVRKAKSTFGRRLTEEEFNRTSSFLAEASSEPSPPPPPVEWICPPPPPPPPCYPPPFPQLPRKKAKKSKYGFGCVPPPMSMPPPPPPPPPFYIDTVDTLDDERHRIYMKDFFMSRLPSLEGCIPKVMRQEAVQASLIKTLAAEVKLREAFDDEVYASAVKFISPASTLSHKVVLTVLKSLGVPDIFLGFFTRFLEAKLSSGSDRVVTRVASVPAGHAMELFFTEAIFFFLEVAVYKRTGLYLYRLHNTCYFVGTTKQGSQVQEEITKFSKIMNMDYSILPGSLPIGNLVLQRQPSAQSSFQISNAEVKCYANRMKKQLDTCSTVLEWIRVWNNTVGTYAAHLFGPLAQVFGSTHLTVVTAAYKLIFSIIFPNSNLTAHVTQMLHSHFSLPLDDPPLALEALIYLPHAYGGLGVKNPFTTLNLARDLPADPSADLIQYMASETQYYDAAATHFRLHTQRRSMPPSPFYTDACATPATGPDSDTRSFIPKSELTSHREYTSLGNRRTRHKHRLATTYRTLLEEPVAPIALGGRVDDELRRLAGRGDMKSVVRLSGEELWVLRLYAAECFERWGGLEIWCAESVPMEAMRGVRGVMWDEDDDSDSDMTSVV